jgi:predicted SAM-dependent methyltransferase
METLDIGSGFHPKGTVNIDLGREFRPTVIAEARKLPFRDSAFDEAYLSHVLEHVVDPENILKETHRVLKAGGCVRIVFPNFSALSVFVAWFMQFSFRPDEKQRSPYIVPPKLQRPYNIVYGSHSIGGFDVHHVPLTLRLMRNLLAEKGFKVESVKGEDFLLLPPRISLSRELGKILSRMFPARADIITIIASKEQ